MRQIGDILNKKGLVSFTVVNIFIGFIWLRQWTENHENLGKPIDERDTSYGYTLIVTLVI